jgi:hypothetical protein
MDEGLVIATALAIAFAVTNGLHDASNAIATLVATRGATPGQAIAMASVCNLAGPLLIGAAVADTIGGIVDVASTSTVAVIGAGLAAAVAWNLVTWRLGLPSSSGHALVGGLGGAALVEGGVSAVEWGGFDGWRPVGLIGTLAALAVSPFPRRVRLTGGDPGPAPPGAARHPAPAWAGPRRRMDDVGGAGLQPRRQRRAEVDGRDRRPAARLGPRGDARGRPCGRSLPVRWR